VWANDSFSGSGNQAFPGRWPEIFLFRRQHLTPTNTGQKDMADPTFAHVGPDADDDLPRTLRRERDAQARRASGQELSNEALPGTGRLEPTDLPGSGYPQQIFDDYDAPAATVTRLDIPLLHLMAFFLKAVIAGVPALLLLLAMLWGIGEVLTATFPELIKMQVLIRMPN